MFAQTAEEIALEAAKKAAEHSWEAFCIVVVLFAALSLLAIIAKMLVAGFIRAQKERDEASQKREERLSTRITNLEVFVQTKLLEALEQCVQALNESVEANRLTAGMLKTATDAVVKLTELHQDLERRLDERTCLLAEENQESLIESIATKITHSVRTKLKQ
jgi:hypothetical protein